MFRVPTVAILFFLLFGSVAYAQPIIPKDVNVLFRKLSMSNADTSRVNTLIGISRYYSAMHATQPALLNSALAAANRANQLAIKLSYPQGIGLSKQVMAYAWCYKRNFKNADDQIKKAIDIFLENKLYRDAAESYLYMEEFYRAAGGGDFAVRIRYYEQAWSLFHQAGAYDREGAALSILGDYYQVVKDFDKSLNRLQMALVAYKKANIKRLQYTYDLMGTVYMQKTQYQEALKYGLLAEKTAIAVNDTTLLLCTIYCRLGTTYFLINNVDQAGIYFDKSLKIALKYKDELSIRVTSQSVFAYLANRHQYAKALTLLNSIVKKYPVTGGEEVIMYYANYIRTYNGLKNYKMAERYVDSLLKTDVLAQGGVTLLYAISEMTEYFIKSGQYKRASKYAPILKETSAKLGRSRNQYKAYLFSFKIDSAMKNYVSAINNYRRFYFIKDSLFDLTKTKQLDELKIKYETEKKEQSIVNLQHNSKLQEQSVKRADTIRNITVGSTIILLLFMILLYKSYSVNKQNSIAIQKKNEALNKLIKEKEWLIKEIHHRVKNNLQIVMGLLQRQSAYIDNDEALMAIQNSENRMQAVALIHQKLYQSENLALILMPEYIDEMVDHLKDSCALENRIFFEKQVDDILLDVAQAVPVGLIINEAVTNAVKYAYPGNITGTIYITMVKDADEQISLTIADNGPGLPDDFNIEMVSSLGLNLIKGLSKQLAGTFEIANEQGCLLNINFKAGMFNNDLPV